MDIEEKKIDHEEFKKAMKEAEELRWKKLLLYGDSYKKFAPLGIFIRMHDKMARIETILEHPGYDLNDERLRDSLIDLANYSFMMILEVDRKNDKKL